MLNNFIKFAKDGLTLLKVQQDHEGHEVRTVIVDPEKGISAEYCVDCKEVLYFNIRMDGKDANKQKDTFIQDNLEDLISSIKSGWNGEGASTDPAPVTMKTFKPLGEKEGETRDFFGSIKGINEKDRTLEGIASTNAKDRDGDIIEVEGWLLNRFKTNPVFLWAHNYMQPPIAKVIKIWKEKDGLHFIAQFPSKGTYELADIVFDLYKEGILKAFSVGFITKKFKPLKGSSWKEDDDGVIDINRTGRKIIEAELLEISSVPVGSNYEALSKNPSLAYAVKNFFSTYENTGRFQEVDEFVKGVTNSMELKKVIPFKKYPLAPEGERWDAGRQVREAEVSDLKLMCTWYDMENEDVKSAYKLPHHRASDKHTVWNGVRAGMGALLGARGGVNIPDSDRRGVYNHLVKHYEEFDKEAPEFRSYSEEELEKMFSDADPKTEDSAKTIGDKLHAEVEIEVNGLEELSEIIHIYKSGRVISAKNKKAIEDAIAKMKIAVSTLENLLKLTEGSQTDDNDNGKGKNADDLIAELKELLKK